MALDVDCEMKKFPDNIDEDTIAANIESWIDGLSITTLHSLTIEHYAGFWWAIVVYV